MATKISEIITPVRTILQDDGTRWTDAELLVWVGAAYREIVTVKPDAGTKTANVSLQNGTLQTMPADAYRLVTLTRNVSPQVTAIRPVDRQLLDIQYPNWHSLPSTNAVDGYVYDVSAPNQFWVFPQASAGMTVEMVYAAIPSAPSALDSDFAINDGYAGLVIDYLLYRAYSKDAGAGDAPLAQTYRQAFYESLGIKKTT